MWGVGCILLPGANIELGTALLRFTLFRGTFQVGLCNHVLFCDVVVLNDFGRNSVGEGVTELEIFILFISTKSPFNSSSP